MSALRQRLVNEHLHLADRAASLIFRRVGEHIEWEELRALGYAGLTEAASRYDANGGAAFATFAWYRVQGAILDGVRKNSQIPAAVWRRAAALQAANQVLEEKANHAARVDRAAGDTATLAQTAHELADAMGLAATASVVSLSHASDGDALLADAAQGGGDNVGEDIDSRRATQRLAKAMAALPARERALLEQTYWNDMSIAAAGEMLGLSRSWASRIHLQALARLRHALADLT